MIWFCSSFCSALQLASPVLLPPFNERVQGPTLFLNTSYFVLLDAQLALITDIKAALGEFTRRIGRPGLTQLSFKRAGHDAAHGVHLR